MRKLLFSLICAIGFSILMTAQVQIGQSILGEAVGDNSGQALGFSSDGTIVAIAAGGNDGGGNQSGHVRIYQFNGTSWEQLGQDIDGEEAGDLSGTDVGLSDDGTIVAIGAYFNDGINGASSGHVRVYQYVGTSWEQLGQDIDGEATFDASGNTISLNGDGTIVAIGSFNNNGNGAQSGHARVYGYNGNIWEQLGQDIDGANPGDAAGLVSINKPGTILAIGAALNDTNGENSGHVRIFNFDGSKWVQMGEAINGAAEGDHAFKASLNANGEVVAIDSRFNDDNGENSGHVRVFEFKNNSWLQIGENIEGEAAFDSGSGYNLSINDIGNIIAIGRYANDGNGEDSGHVRIYQNIDEIWVQQGEDIDGENTDNFFGWAVKLNNAGDKVAIGAPTNFENATESGHVRVFDLTNILSFEDQNLLENIITIFPNPIKGNTLYVQLPENSSNDISFSLYNILGDEINDTIDTSSINQGYIKGFSKLQAGVYFLNLTTTDKAIVKKIIKQ